MPEVLSSQFLVAVLAEADQRGFLTLLTGAPVFRSIGVRLVKVENGLKFQNERLVTVDELGEHGLDAIAYMIKTMMQQIDFEIRRGVTSAT